MLEHTKDKSDISKANSLEELLENCPQNSVIGDSLVKAWSKINNPMYEKIICSISDGSDSDVMLDVCWRCDKDNKIDYVWFDTGLEYQATKNHLKYLEKKYGIEIQRYKTQKTIPLCCKEYGQPFLSKQVSEFVYRLQKHNFKWEDRPFDELYKEYPRCKSALQWWCDAKKVENSTFSIKRNKWLKEFMVENPPTFKISSKCCTCAKKNPVHKIIKENKYDLDIVGVRRAEGGVRSQVYKNCFSTGSDSDRYRPLFWYTDKDKEEYENFYDVKHSDCYAKYGLKRTGCAGCVYGRNFEFELDVVKQYEQKLYVGINNIFKESYEYTRKYKEFVKTKNEEPKKSI